MKKLLFIIALLIEVSNGYAQVVQFSQLPVSLNPALAGSVDVMRVSAGRSYLKETADDFFDHYSDVTSLTSINVDKFVPKLKSGVGLNVNMGDWQHNAYHGSNSYGFGINKSNATQIGLAIAPKFSSKSTHNPNLTQSTWSPALEVNYKFSNENISAIYGGQKVDLGVLKVSALGFRLGMTRVGKRSVLGICYGYQRNVESSGFTLMYNDITYDSLGNAIKSVPASRDYRYSNYINQSFLAHYGLSVNLNQSGTFSMSMQWLISLTMRSTSSASSRSVYNFYDNYSEILNKDQLIQNLNFRYKKALMGFSFNTGGYYGVTPYYSVGYQSRQTKIIATFGYLNHSQYGELTCSYVFK